MSAGYLVFPLFVAFLAFVHSCRCLKATKKSLSYVIIESIFVATGMFVIGLIILYVVEVFILKR